MKSPKNHCDFCDGKTEKKLVEKKINRYGQSFTFQIEAEVCQKCGEKYYDGKQLLEAEQQLEKMAASVA